MQDIHKIEQVMKSSLERTGRLVDKRRSAIDVGRQLNDHHTIELFNSIYNR